MSGKEAGVSKVRINELARELGVKSSTIINLLAGSGQAPRSHSSALGDEVAQEVREQLRRPAGTLSSPVRGRQVKPMPGSLPVKASLGVAAKPMAVCPECGESVGKDRLAKHRKKSHRIKPIRPKRKQSSAGYESSPEQERFERSFLRGGSPGLGKRG